mmetsp:Transcript_66280/g.181763  ORF Transcript_66280/g.181763 Transcript_66280/m.181763 type:complete len:106 (+) Transcript_66280:30-347(+)
MFVLALSVGFVVPPAPMLPMLRLHTSPVMVLPGDGLSYATASVMDDRVGFATTSVLMDVGDRSDWAVSIFGSLDLDAIAVAAIPVALVVVLALFFRMLKLFASAF